MNPASLSLFREPVRRWFRSALGAPTRAQELAWNAIASGHHTLVLAPTGSGKTLAAFLCAIDHTMFDGEPSRSERCRVLYISPLKALAVDIERNLRQPIERIADEATAMGVPFRRPEIAVRTGDTPGRERQRFARRPTDILITTPESLYLVLTSGAREALRSVRWVILDEIHAVVGTKRGTHLALTLERLEALQEATDHAPFQRIGLSATQRPLDEIARFLGGFESNGDQREVVIADAGSRKRLDLAVTAPQRPVIRRSEPGERDGPTWTAIHETLLEQIRAHRSTLIFVNSRRLAERLAGALNELAGEEIVAAHHGSVSREQRLMIEENLKAGRLPALVATSSLELGIDMGAIDLVIQIEAPPSVSAAMQRIGRSGHQVDTPSKGIIIPKHPSDLPACAAAVERMRSGAVERMRYARNPLDVLAQQIVAMVSMDAWTVADLYRLIRRAAPYHDLAESALHSVLDMLSGRYPSSDFSDLRPRITWDRQAGLLTPRDGARRTAIGSGGTIPNRGQYGVFLHGVPPALGRVGELEEIMVFESKIGDVFLLGATGWRILDITPDRVIVAPAPGVPGRMPFWHGDNPGRPAEFGEAIGSLIRTVGSMPQEDARRFLEDQHALTPEAAVEMLEYLDRQRQAAGSVPDDRTIVVERHRDEIGEWRVCILTPYGSRVHAPWAMAIGATLRDRTGVETDVMWTENGIVVRAPDAEQPPPTEWLLPDPALVRDLVIRQLAFGGGASRQMSHGAPVTALFASHFREAAGRALLLPQRRPGKRSPLWLTRKRAADLLHIVARYQDFPIVLETVRECLQDVFDMSALTSLLERISSGEISVVTADTLAPSPFASSLLFSYIANFMYEGDAPMAERRAQALTLDPVRLRELLGEGELRDLLDAEAVAEVEASLQALGDRRPRGKDGIHDLLIRLGDLTTDEIIERTAEEPDRTSEWLRLLAAEGRALSIRLGGEERWIAVEDASRYRDAIGVALPSDLHASFQEAVHDPLGDLIVRYARTHGPFTSSEVADRFAMGEAPVRTALRSLAADGRIVEGEFRPGGAGVEWCAAEVLQSLRTRSLARLRRQIEPVDHATFVRFLLEWHGIGMSPSVRNPEELLEAAVRRLQGAPLVASHLERDILKVRMPGYDRRDLDLMLASGGLLWTGDGRVGDRDGRIRLLFADDAPFLSHGPATEPPELDGLERGVYGYLNDAGASFFAAIVQGVRGFQPEVLNALWELVWKGLVTNDTLAPLRSLVHPQPVRRTERMDRRRTGSYRSRPPAGVLGGRPIPATAQGRWSAIDGGRTELRREDRLAAWVGQLVDRYGVLTRETALAEGIEGGFSGLYPLLDAMETSGRLRRGYFIEGLGATQFAAPEAVEMLRRYRLDPVPDESRSDAVVLAATDPANPFGAALPWPDAPTLRRPTRSAGSYICISDGRPMAWLSVAERRLILFAETDEVRKLVASAVDHAIRDERLDPLILGTVNDGPAVDHPISHVAETLGHASGSRGIVFRRPSSFR